MLDYQHLTDTELFHALASADAMAADEYVRRQPKDMLPRLHNASRLLSSVAAAVHLSRPDELMAFKYPEEFAPVDEATLAEVLGVLVAREDTGAARALLEPLSFTDVAAIRSLAGFLQQHAGHGAPHADVAARQPPAP